MGSPQQPTAEQTARLEAAGQLQLVASPELRDRLRELGLGEEQRIKLLSSEANVICQVCNARLALSEKLAKAILVEPVAAKA